MALTRLQKVLATAGISSRRKAEEIITQGRVRVNGRVIKELGTKVNPARDRIEVDGKVLAAEEVTTVLMNKPRGVVCTVSDPEGRPTVLEYLKDVKGRVFPVGRLDFATSGALLLTNDGDLAFALTHPKHGVEKTYLMKVRGPVPDEILDRWREGVDIGDVVTRPAEVFRVEVEENYTWVEVTIKEGRNRQLRRMAEATGVDLVKLKRVAFAGLTIERLPIGKWRPLTAQEVARLKRLYVNPARRDKLRQSARDRGVADPEDTEATAAPSAPAARPRKSPRVRRWGQGPKD